MNIRDATQFKIQTASNDIYPSVTAKVIFISNSSKGEHAMKDAVDVQKII
jgi:hypothetical protein